MHQEPLAFQETPPEDVLDLWVRVKQIFLSAFVAGAVPVDGVVRHGVQLLAQLAGQLRFTTSRTFAVQVAHREVHHAAVAPEATRMQVADAGPATVRQEPHLRSQRVHAHPVVHAQHGEPKLAPTRDKGCAATTMDPGTSSNRHGVFGRHAQQTGHHITETRAKHGASSFNMEAKPTIRVLVISEVSDGFFDMLLCEDLGKTVRCIKCNYQTR
mmetsp:Transcript_19286/g.34852  ORF Transcript_19286/g.34852 Transcript_19286/m.34852 type:complete len:213 (-) Transcript_19286:632-1270(-)